MQSHDTIITFVKFVFALAALAAVVGVVVLPLVRMIRTGPDPDLLNPYAKLPPPGEEEMELEVPVGGDKRLPGRAEMIEMARKDTRQVATLVSQWLREKK